MEIEKEPRMPDEFLQEAYIKLIKRCEYHELHAKSEKNIYRWLGYFLNVIIPVISAIIAFLSGIDSEKSRLIIGILSLLLTVLTVVNSTLKPSGRYIFLADKLIKLHDWKFEVNSVIYQMLVSVDEDMKVKISEFLKQKNIEMSELGRDLAKNKLPEFNNSGN